MSDSATPPPDPAAPPTTDPASSDAGTPPTPTSAPETPPCTDAPTPAPTASAPAAISPVAPEEAPGLARFVLENIAIRTDIHGGAYVKAGKAQYVTRKTPLTEELLAKHFLATEPADIRGVHDTDQSGQSKFVVIDIDAHAEDGREDRMKVLLAQAVAIEGILDSQYGLGCLIDASRRGVKCWLLIEEPVATETARKAGLVLARRAGCDPKVEIFPKERGKGKKPAWVRLPGLHKDHLAWSTLYKFGQAVPPEKWAETLLNWKAVPVKVIEDLAAETDHQPLTPGEGGDRLPDVRTILTKGVEEGRRHDSLVKLAAHARAQGLDADELKAHLHAANDKFDGPLEAEEVDRIAEDYAQKDVARGAKESQASQIVKLLQDVDLFHAPDGTAFATISVEGHYETWRVESSTFRDYVSREVYKRTGKVPAASTINDALGVINGLARFDGLEREVFIRVGRCGDAIYLDLANPEWEAIEITAAGWRVVKDCPVKFIRANGMLPLPHPERGGSLDLLRPFLNLEDDSQWTLAKAWLLGCLHPTGPFPVLILIGEHGSLKSTTQHMLRNLVDPNLCKAGFTVKGLDDLALVADSAWIVSFDNSSHFTQDMVDALCRLSTGGSFSKRKLWRDRDLEHFHAKRPVAINSIVEIVSQSDLLDRAVLLAVPVFEGNREQEETVWARFNEVRPQLLGALCDAVREALAAGAFQLMKAPRMADFATWVAAGSSQLGFSIAEFLDAFEQNREDSRAVALEASPVAEAVKELLSTTPTWKGTAADLLAALAPLVTEETKRDRYSWPRSPRGMRSALDRVAADLRRTGISVRKSREAGGDRDRLIHLEVTPPADQPAVVTPEARRKRKAIGMHSKAARRARRASQLPGPPPEPEPPDFIPGDVVM